MKKTLIIFFIIAVATSCMKENGGSTPVVDDGTIETAKVPLTFKWQTDKNVTLNVAGYNTQLIINELLTINTESGTNLYSVYYPINKTSSISLRVPVGVTKLIVKYGTIEKTIDIVNNSSSFNFVVPDEE